MLRLGLGRFQFVASVQFWFPKVPTDWHSSSHPKQDRIGRTILFLRLFQRHDFRIHLRKFDRGSLGELESSDLNR